MTGYRLLYYGGVHCTRCWIWKKATLIAFTVATREKFSVYGRSAPPNAAPHRYGSRKARDSRNFPWAVSYKPHSARWRNHEFPSHHRPYRREYYFRKSGHKEVNPPFVLARGIMPLICSHCPSLWLSSPGLTLLEFLRIRYVSYTAIQTFFSLLARYYSIFWLCVLSHMQSFIHLQK